MTKQQYYGGKLPKTPAMHYVEELVDYALKQEVKMTKDEIKTALERCNNDDCINCPYISYSKCRDILIDAALNLITEQEREIERLKSKCEEQDNEIDRLECAVKENDERCFDCPQAKQAKIDVLNELKTHSYFDDYYIDSYVFVSDIDGMIEELEK